MWFSAVLTHFKRAVDPSITTNSPSIRHAVATSACFFATNSNDRPLGAMALLVSVAFGFPTLGAGNCFDHLDGRGWKLDHLLSCF